jgi:hypothetical protein
MSQAQPVDAVSKPKSSNAGIVAIIVVLLAIVCIPAVLGALAVAGGVLAYWTLPSQTATMQPVETMSAPAVYEAASAETAQP